MYISGFELQEEHSFICMEGEVKCNKDELIIIISAFVSFYKDKQCSTPTDPPYKQDVTDIIRSRCKDNKCTISTSATSGYNGTPYYDIKYSCFKGKHHHNYISQFTLRIYKYDNTMWLTVAS